MNIKGIGFVISLLGLSILSKAQTNYYVKITDQNNQIIQKATVFCEIAKDSGFAVYSDSAGICSLLDGENIKAYYAYAPNYEPYYFKLKHDNTSYDKAFWIKLSTVYNEHNEAIVTGQTKAILAGNSVQKVSVLNRKDILKQGATTLNDALKIETGFNFQQDNILGSNLNIQGIGGQNIKILYNGIPINGRENGNIDISQINLANVERIEYIKGPMSVMYGSDALGGVINIISRNDKIQNQGNFNAQYESVGRYNLNASLIRSVKNRNYNLSFGRNLFQGFGYLDSFNRRMTWKPKEQYFLESGFTLNSAQKFKFNYNIGLLKEHVLNLGTPVVDPFSAYALDEHYYNTRLSNTALLDFKLRSNDKLVFTNNHSYYTRKRVRLIKDMTTLEETLTADHSDQDTTHLNNLNFRGNYSTDRIRKTELNVGYEVNAEYLNSSKIVEHKKNIQDYALYGSARIQAHPKWIIQPSLRYAYNSISNTPLIPNVNIKYSAGSNFSIRASFGKGFRIPSLKESYLSFVDQNHYVLGNENLKPEVSYNYQISADKLLYKDSSKRVKLNLASYYNNIYNQISLALLDLSTNKYQYANNSNFKNFAFESGLDFSHKYWQIKIAALYNNILTARNGAGIDNWDLNSKVSYNWEKRKTSFLVLYRYISRQPLLSINSIDNSSNYNAWLPAMQILDFISNTSILHNNINLQVGVKNILNVQSLMVAGSNGGVHSSGTQSIQPARSLLLGLGWKLN